MHPPELTRRRLLATGVGTGIAGVLGGCQALGGGSLPDRSGTDILQHAPDAAIVASHLDVSALLDDEELRRALDDHLRTGRSVSDRVPASTRAALDEVDAALGLDPRGLSRALAIVVRRPDVETAGDGFDPLAGTSAAVQVWSDWSPSAVLDAVDRRWGPVETDARRGIEVYETDAATVAAPGEGRYVVGQPAAVNALLDVLQGDATAEGGRLARALGASRPGPIRVAVAPRSGDDGRDGFGNPIALLAGKIDVAFGSLHATDGGDRRVLELVFRTGDGFDAEDVQESVESLLALARLAEPGPAWETLLSEAEVSRSGAAVVVRYVAPTSAFAATLLSLASAVVEI